MNANTLFIRLEAPLQSWGDNNSKFVVRRTCDAPTKSGVMGILCAALGVSRPDARYLLAELNDLRMGVRIDRPGVRWWDYHTVGAGMQMRIAEGDGKSKPGAMLTRREYLCDASFLVALQGDSQLINRLHGALLRPVWQVFLGRKSCPPSLPLVGWKGDHDTAERDDLESALRLVPWRKRRKHDLQPDRLEFLLEWPVRTGEAAPSEAEVWYDVARSFDVPGHEPRLIVRRSLSVGGDIGVAIGAHRQNDVAPPPRPRADYTNSDYRKRRAERLETDQGLCVFCKLLATTVQHVTYRRAGGNETADDLRALCRLCHDAVTMIEYGQGMGLDRINPEDPRWRSEIIAKRAEIIGYRSLETRRRRLRREEVE